MALGGIAIRGISLGPAGVLFAAMIAGHWGLTLPRDLTELGLVLFVYAVGLQAGPRFVGMFRLRGAALLAAAGGATLVGALVAVLGGTALGLTGALTAGLYCGATTCTPALAALMDNIRVVAPEQAGMASVGYGLAYPFGLVAVVAFVQVLPRLLRQPPEEAARDAAVNDPLQAPPLEARTFRVTNPNCVGRTVQHLHDLKVANARISRVKHGAVVQMALPDTTLHAGDVVRAVGAAEELEKLATLLGAPVEEPMSDPTGGIASEEIVVSQPSVIGKSLAALDAWSRYGVVVTRARREGIEFAPRGRFVLEKGDVLRVVGAPESVARFRDLVGSEERRLEETSLLPFAGGLVLGALLGSIPLPFPGSVRPHLGMAGGAFLAAILLSNVGSIGPLRLYVPAAARAFSRELGLVIFLAGAGTAAGERFVEVVQQAGWQVVLAGALVTLSTAGAAVLLAYRILVRNMLTVAGSLSAAMTNPAALAAASRLAVSDAPAVAFATIYPVALLCKIVLAQLVYLAVRN